MIIRKEYRYDQPTSYTCDGICCAVDKSGHERECEMYLYYNGCEVDFYGGEKRIVANNFDFEGEK